MLAQNTKANRIHYNIVMVLRHLKKEGLITEKEYMRALRYYREKTGSDLYIVD